MHVQNYYTDLDGVKVQQIINAITKEYVYAGLGGFPELPSAQPQGAPTPVRPAPVVFNPSILASLPPPPGFKIPIGPNGMPMFPPPPPMHQGGFAGQPAPMTFNGMMPPPPPQ